MGNVSIAGLQLSISKTAMGSLEQTAQTDSEKSFEMLMSQAGISNLQETRYVPSKKEEDFSVKTQYEKASSGCQTDAKVSCESRDDAMQKLAKKTTEAVDEAADQVKNALEEQLGVSEEDIEAVMEQLGLCNADLLTVNNLAELVTQLTGSQDTMSLLMNADFQNLMEQLGQIVTEVTEALQMDVSQVQELYGEFLTEMEQTSDEIPAFSEEQMELAETISKELSVQSPQTESVKAQSDKAVEDYALQETLPKEQTSVIKAEQEQSMADEDDQMGQTATSETRKNAEVKAEDVDSEDVFGKALQESSGKQHQASETVQVSVVQNVQQTATGTQTVVTQVTQSYLTAGEMESILSQVTREAVIQITDTSSIMEMQLNPENLGRVTLQVVAKEGLISAQITAQNEAVRQALESQMTVLRENLNSQGLKVESIEVTVETHEFERNLEQNEQGRQQQEQQEQKSGGRRNLRMDHLEELQGLMTEEESLLAKMMAENGNSMDLTA